MTPLLRSLCCVPAMVALTFLLKSPVHAQFTSNAKDPTHQAYYDSLKAMNYPYALPLLARKAYKRGFDIPYTYGISTVFYRQRQNVEITSTLIGFGDSEPVDLSGFIEFGSIEAVTTAYTVRPDVWVLPFLNVYGIFGTGTTETTVPLVNPVTFSTTQKFHVSSAGLGVTLAGGLGPVFVVVDNNINWADVESLAEPVPAYNLDARIGHNFVSSKRADQGLALWFGTFYQKLSNDTEGSILIRDLFPDGSAGLEGHFIDRLHEWADGLPPAQKIVANQIINKVDAYFQGLDLGDTPINYKLDKEVAAPWNLVFGAQYQFNKHYQVRTEVGTFGQRSSFLLMLNYRFETIRFKRKK